MISYLLMAVIVGAVTFWVRGMRRARRDWLTQLNLPGTWRLDRDDESRLLRLGGSLDGGRYVARDGMSEEHGDWRLAGHTLVLRPDGDADDGRRFDLRQFDTGRIGIDGPGREREIYVKRADNVIELRARS